MKIIAVEPWYFSVKLSVTFAKDADAFLEWLKGKTNIHGERLYSPGYTPVVALVVTAYTRSNARRLVTKLWRQWKRDTGRVEIGAGT